MTDLHGATDGPAGAPVLVLGPSLGTDLQLFDAQVAALAGRYRVVRFDLPGHGDSPVSPGPYTVAGLARDVLVLLDRLGVDRFHYAGVSLGGAIGLQLAIEHGERLRSLTVCASAARFPDPESYGARAATVRARGTEALEASRPGTWFTHGFARRNPAEAQRLLAVLRATNREGYAGCCEAIATFDVVDRLGSIRVPTLAIAGADDPATPPDTVRLIADRVPGARFVVVPDGAHLVNAEQPDAVTGAVVEHLGRSTLREAVPGTTRKGGRL